MDQSEEARSANETSVKRIAIILGLAFLGSELSLFAAVTMVVANFGFIISYTFDAKLAAIAALALSVLLLFGSFLAQTRYPRRGKIQVVGACLAILPWEAGMILSFAVPYWNPADFIPWLPYTLRVSGVGLALVCALLASGRIRGLPDLIGLGLGILLGIGLLTTDLYKTIYFDYSALWLSAVFFSELLSKRMNWRSALLGFGLWAGLILLSIYITRLLQI